MRGGWNRKDIKLLILPLRVAVTGLNGKIATEDFTFTMIYNITNSGFDVEWKCLSGAAVSGSAEFGYYALGE